MQMSEAVDLAESVDSVEAFVARFPDPVLLNVDSLDSVQQGATFATPAVGSSTEPFRRESSKDPSEETCLDVGPSHLLGLLNSRESAVAEATPPRGSLKAADVYVLKKTSRNPFLQMITVGRTGNNDVIIDDKTVSKLHAYFVKQGEVWSIHDQCSTNGTYVERQRVPATGLVVRDTDRVSFGTRHVFRFHTPAGFYRLVRAVEAPSA
ncbi:FHA domain-containing protein [bacterium]|nr:FHA domain-containing protein [bacterium]